MILLGIVRKGNQGLRNLYTPDAGMGISLRNERVKMWVLLIYKLTEKYWDTLWPKFESSDSDARISPYKWLATKDLIFLKTK